MVFLVIMHLTPITRACLIELSHLDILVNVLLTFNPFLVFTYRQYKSFENTVGKGEIARDEQFLLFPTVFSTLLENFLPFSSNSKLSSANSFNLKESKICRLGMG